MRCAGPPRLVQTLAAHRVTRLRLVPSLLRVLLDPYLISASTPHLKLWLVSGETLAAELCQRFLSSATQSPGQHVWRV